MITSRGEEGAGPCAGNSVGSLCCPCAGCLLAREGYYLVPEEATVLCQRRLLSCAR